MFHSIAKVYLQPVRSSRLTLRAPIEDVLLGSGVVPEGTTTIRTSCRGSFDVSTFNIIRYLSDTKGGFSISDRRAIACELELNWDRAAQLEDRAVVRVDGLEDARPRVGVGHVEALSRCIAGAVSGRASFVISSLPSCTMRTVFSTRPLVAE